MPAPSTVPELAAGGVLLTAWSEQDVPGVLALADDDASRRYSASLAGVRSPADARRWLDDRGRDGRLDWAVRDPGNGTLIGRSALHQIVDRPPSAEVGYGVHPAHRGRGVATAAVTAVTRWAFAELGLQRLTLLHDLGNRASCAVAARAGYLLEGVERAAMGYPDGRVADVHRHARLASDPAPPAELPPPPLDVPVLEGDGVRLRPWRDDEAATYARGMADPESARWSNAPQPFGTDDALRLLARLRRAARDGDTVAWAVEADGAVAGSLALRGVNRVDEFVSVAYWVLPESRGRGVAPRALRLATTYAFEELGLHRVRLQHAVANTASCRVAEKAGFALESLQRESCLLRGPAGPEFVDEHQHVRLADR